MTLDHSDSLKFLEVSFRKVDETLGPNSFPPIRSLSSALSPILTQARTRKLNEVTIPAKAGHLFATASIEMWHRAIHSFLWSIVLSKSSRIWASVSGYYSSHYVMRAFSHALGFYNSF